MPSNVQYLWGRDQLYPTLEERETAEKHGISIISITDPTYPQSLKILSDPPPLLYVKGPLPDVHAKKLAIVGTRAATSWGLECTRLFAKELSDLGVWIVSGLARGIDTAAHNASIGRTCAFIGSGLLHIYPKENEALADKITVISELPLYTAPTRYTFPRRNRLISAFSDAILMTEAPVKSGAMITMNIGHKQSKPLFTVPGRAMSENYAGNHSLIKEQKAELIETPQELAQKMGLFCQRKGENKLTNILISPPEQKILDILYQSEVSIDELSVKCCLPISILQVSLTKLVLRKLAEELPGKRYKYIG
ncbi:MAG: DNA-protecting protein DprA [Verrucomicrobia bacterium]|nr:DNA-protecting protein DprA [Verrucomicrobiota bacterium]MBS0635977.1 DNA-protecting protein DprA [Verrucomicrobiota bacterium]